jgi:hypothetical protein
MTNRIEENLELMNEYIYLGDRNTELSLKGKACSAVRRPDGKCIRGKNGSMLVTFGETKMVVVGRLLRKIQNSKLQQSNSKQWLS